MQQKSFIQKLIPAARQSLLRFPLTLLCAAGISVFAVLLIENGNDDRLFTYVNLLLTLAIGLPLSIAAQLLVESPFLNNRLRSWTYLTCAALLIVISISLPQASWQIQSAVPFIRFALCFASAHLLLALIPILYKKGINGFWNYNKALFIQLFIAQVFTIALTWGLQLAFLALKLLFDLDISEKLFFEIAVVVYSVFHTWFFLSNYPSDFDALEADQQYPKGLQVFSQFILLPLVTLYLLILFAYGTKIILSWSWPKGLVSYLIVCIASIGGFTFLLLHPYAEKSAHTLIRNSTRWYYRLLIPLLGLLFIAIFMRINDYGFTISRYALLVFGLWALTVAVYAQFRQFNIRYIPMSLVFVLLLSSVGPWGFDAFCANQQKSRLEKILTQSGYLKDGKLLQETRYSHTSLKTTSFVSNRALNDSLHLEVISIVQYLDEFHTCSVLESWFQQPVDSIYRNLCRSSPQPSMQPSERELYLTLMGIDPNGPTTTNDENKSVQIYDEHEPTIFMINGYDFLINLEQPSSNPILANQSIRIFDTTFKQAQIPLSFSIIQLPGESTTWIVSANDSRDTLHVSSILHDVCSEAEKKNGMSTQSNALTIRRGPSMNWGYQIYFSRLDAVRNKNGRYSIQNAKTRILLRTPK